MLIRSSYVLFLYSSLLLVFELCLLTPLTSQSSLIANETLPSADLKLAQDRPNILWLSAEDIGPHLGCYGDPDAVTPHLDELATRSVVYDLAWSNYPVCAPARTTIIGGIYAAASAAGNMRSESILPPGVEMFPHYLRSEGYYCTNNSKKDYNYFMPKKNVPWDESSKKAHYRNREEGQPFFAVFNYNGTHESKIRIRPHKKIIDPATVHLPSYWPDISEVRNDWAQYHDNITGLDKWVNTQLLELQREGLAESTIVVFFGDHGSGMPRHKRFAGDSGMRVPLIVHVPKKYKQLAAKDYSPGIHSQRPVGFVDFAPTMLSIAGIKPTQTMQGHAFLGQHQTEAPKYLYGFRDRMDERPDVSRSIRDDQFIYIRNYMPHLPAGQDLEFQTKTDTTAMWRKLYAAGKLNDTQSHFFRPRSPEELYNLKDDPEETINLAASPDFAEVLERFRKEHKESYHRFGDLGLVPEPIAFDFKDGKTSRRLMVEEKSEFPLDEIFEVANFAVDQRFDKLVSASQSHSPTVRYWAALGMLIDGGSSFDDASESLGTLLQDSSPVVAIVAAKALAAHGTESQKQLAISKLVHFADFNNSNVMAAVHALNAIERQAAEDLRPFVDRLKNLPTEDGKTKRGGGYIPRILRSIESKTNNLDLQK